MIKGFTKQHPWLTGKIKLYFWNFLEWIKAKSFVYHFENGQKIKLDPTDDSVGKPIFFGRYENDVVSFVKKYIKRGDVVLDVGANIGFFTLIFSELVGENGKVHSFEPSQREFLHLCENININQSRNIFLNQMALSNQNGFSKMNVLSENKFGAYNSLRKITHAKVQNKQVYTEDVRTIKFDGYLTLFADAIPGLVKIDVEGFEKQVLEGMQIFLRSDCSPCLIVEVYEGTHIDEQGGVQELIAYIESFGYVLYSANSVGDLKPFRVGISLNCIALKQFHLMMAADRGVNVVV